MSSRKTLNTALAFVGIFSSCLVAVVNVSGVYSNVKCFDDYTEARTEILNDFQSSYIKCEGDPTHQRPLAAVDVEGEKTNLAKTSEEICFSLKACHQIGDPKSYLECYSMTASENFIKSLGIHFNASSIVIELSEDYEEAEKDVMRCNLQANRDFMTDSFNAFKQFLDCMEAE